MKLFLIRYTKLIFIYLRLHVIFRLFNGLFSNFLFLNRLSSWAAKNRRIPYNDFPSRWNYQKRYSLYQWVMSNEQLSEIPINYLEFGVADGHSFRWFVQQNHNQQSCFHGFDTFTGLPEDFGVYKKGDFNRNQHPPGIADGRVSFHAGLFQQTLPGFLNSLKKENRNIVMLDADLYSSTLYVLTSLAPFLKKNDIIFFDEFAVPTHEFKAYAEFSQSFYMPLELIGAANNYYFVAFRVMKTE